MADRSQLEVKLPVRGMLVGFIVIFALLVLTTAATHFIPAGTYRRQSRIDERTGSTLEVVIPDSFRYTDANPQGLLAFLYSPVKSLYYQGPVGAIIVVFILLVGGAFTAIRRTGALDSGIAAFIHGMKGREPVVLILMMLVFSLFGSLLGLLEELVPFVLIVAPLAAAMGYDAVVGVMMIFGACAVGFTAAMMNPFTLGVAQALAGLPLFSGLLFRLIVWIVMLGIAVLYTYLYARRVQADPARSLLYSPAGRSGRAGSSAAAASSRAGAAASPSSPGLTPAHRRVLRTIGIMVVLLLLTITAGQFAFPSLMGSLSFPLVILFFLIMGVLSGLFGGLGIGGTLKAFGRGIITFLPAAAFIMLARAVIVVATEGRIIDTILFTLASVVTRFTSILASWAMLIIQTALNFFIPSGSAQAVVSMPVMIPLGELAGITRQSAVLAFQMGDGFSNMLWPTNPTLIVALALAGVPWTRWARFMVPLQLIFLAAGFATLAAAVAIGWGPF
jgi:uncharacterized ion transporter superfamily protein YfcC